MLVAAFRQEARDEILLDLLTERDLELLKHKKQNTQSESQLSVDNVKQKRYLILTLKGEYEKTHYPLPLRYLEEPDLATMRKTFSRLQSHIKMNNTNTFSTISYAQSEGRAVDDFVLIESENQ